MALSRKNTRQMKRLRKDANRLWEEQQVVFAKARELASRAGGAARVYTESEVLPPVRDRFDSTVRPAFDQGLETGRKALAQAEHSMNKTVLPAIAALGGTVAGAVKHCADRNSDVLKNLQHRTGDFSKDAQKRFVEIQKRFEPAPPKKSGPGVGGWFLIGAGVAAVAAIGYALWQTFRADDDLWIADEELDAPVQTVETPRQRDAAGAPVETDGTTNSATS